MFLLLPPSSSCLRASFLPIYFPSFLSSRHPTSTHLSIYIIIYIYIPEELSLAIRKLFPYSYCLCLCWVVYIPGIVWGVGNGRSREGRWGTVGAGRELWAGIQTGEGAGRLGYPRGGREGMSWNGGGCKIPKEGVSRQSRFYALDISYCRSTVHSLFMIIFVLYASLPAWRVKIWKYWINHTLAS